MGIINKPHDKFFKETLSNIENSRSFMENYLPSEILNIVDLDNLTVEKDSYIDEELEEYFSDILFKTNINQKEGYIYFLFEHKSYVSDTVSLQLLKYILKIWERKLKKEKQEKLPLIIPMVIYHGENKWNIAKELTDMIEGVAELPKDILKYIPNYEYILYDLSPYGGEEIKGNVQLRIFLEILKTIYNKDIEEFIKVLEKSIIALERLENQDKGIDYFETFIRYIMNARQDISIIDVYEVVKNISLERSEEIMTIAEQLIKEGMEKGMEKGIKEGERKTARNLIRLGYLAEQVVEATDLTMEEVMELKKETDN